MWCSERLGSVWAGCSCPRARRLWSSMVCPVLCSCMCRPGDFRGCSASSLTWPAAAPTTISKRVNSTRHLRGWCSMWSVSCRSKNGSRASLSLIHARVSHRSLPHGSVRWSSSPKPCVSSSVSTRGRSIALRHRTSATISCSLATMM